jgi:tRNA/tmRNA/rRNA uracil-C5-methylase (TrmA/RlmC/RlmD family)
MINNNNNNIFSVLGNDIDTEIFIKTDEQVEHTSKSVDYIKNIIQKVLTNNDNITKQENLVDESITKQENLVDESITKQENLVDESITKQENPEIIKKETSQELINHIKTVSHEIISEIVDKVVSKESTNKNKYAINSWDDIINDKSYLYKSRKIRIFPVLKNKGDYSKIQIDEDSFNFITIREIADFTSKIICHHLINDFLNPLKTVICDLTAGVGGNILSFSCYFKQVHAIEIMKDRYDFLINNVGLYKHTNISFYNSCAIEFIDNKLLEVNPSVLFIDPPWGGVGYKKNDNLELSLGDLSLEDLLIYILNKFSIIYSSCNKNLEYSSEHNKLIVFKLPKNYNIIHFYKYIKNTCINNYIVKNYLYVFNKMILVLCHCVYVNYQIDS